MRASVPIVGSAVPAMSLVLWNENFVHKGQGLSPGVILLITLLSVLAGLVTTYVLIRVSFWVCLNIDRVTYLASVWLYNRLHGRSACRQFMFPLRRRARRTLERYIDNRNLQLFLTVRDNVQSSTIRNVLRDIPRVQHAKYHNTAHQICAAERTNSQNTILMMGLALVAREAGTSLWFNSMPSFVFERVKEDPTLPITGARPCVNGKDLPYAEGFGKDPLWAQIHRAYPPEGAIVIFTDDDFYLSDQNMADIIAHRICLVSGINPLHPAGSVGNTAWSLEVDILKQISAGNSRYQHELWDFNTDTMNVYVKRFHGSLRVQHPTLSKMDYDTTIMVESRQLNELRMLAITVPVAHHAPYVMTHVDDSYVPFQKHAPLKRINVKAGKFLRIDYLLPQVPEEGPLDKSTVNSRMVVALAHPGSWRSIILPHEAFQAMWYKVNNKNLTGKERTTLLCPVAVKKYTTDGPVSLSNSDLALLQEIMCDIPLESNHVIAPSPGYDLRFGSKVNVRTVPIPNNVSVLLNGLRFHWGKKGSTLRDCEVYLEDIMRTFPPGDVETVSGPELYSIAKMLVPLDKFDMVVAELATRRYARDHPFTKLMKVWRESRETSRFFGARTSPSLDDMVQRFVREDGIINYDADLHPYQAGAYNFKEPELRGTMKMLCVAAHWCELITQFRATEAHYIGCASHEDTPRALKFLCENSSLERLVAYDIRGVDYRHPKLTFVQGEISDISQLKRHMELRNNCLLIDFRKDQDSKREDNQLMRHLEGGHDWLFTSLKWSPMYTDKLLTPADFIVPTVFRDAVAGSNTGVYFMPYTSSTGTEVRVLVRGGTDNWTRVGFEVINRHEQFMHTLNRHRHMHHGTRFSADNVVLRGWSGKGIFSVYGALANALAALKEDTTTQASGSGSSSSSSWTCVFPGHTPSTGDALPSAPPVPASSCASAPTPVQATVKKWVPKAKKKQEARAPTTRSTQRVPVGGDKK